MKLKINTQYNSVVLCGDFCGWEMDKAMRIDRLDSAKMITVKGMPIGEYRVFACKDYTSGEVYATDGRQMGNRYFSGVRDDIIDVYFEKLRGGNNG